MYLFWRMIQFWLDDLWINIPWILPRICYMLKLHNHYVKLEVCSFVKSLHKFYIAYFFFVSCREIVLGTDALTSYSSTGGSRGQGPPHSGCVAGEGSTPPAPGTSQCHLSTGTRGTRPGTTWNPQNEPASSRPHSNSRGSPHTTVLLRQNILIDVSVILSSSN